MLLVGHRKLINGEQTTKFSRTKQLNLVLVVILICNVISSKHEIHSLHTRVYWLCVTLLLFAQHQSNGSSTNEVRVYSLIKEITSYTRRMSKGSRAVCLVGLSLCCELVNCSLTCSTQSLYSTTFKQRIAGQFNLLLIPVSRVYYIQRHPTKLKSSWPLKSCSPGIQLMQARHLG